ncbi:hypothetical protein LF1_18080 [Rubripirellula obstinata]|uniref:RanBP2-type domain-containing protein n=2 Tax=Rubripirellula obstinata TaxID=406547 RepID=A0A5B1CDT2_9BACT|nr:hypothetical protein LF1_18080 [Rubripirellula obstinata]
MVVLQRFSDSVAAETLRGRLAVAGIDTFVRGTSIETAFGLGGAPTSSGLRVEIAKRDVDAALAIMAEDQRIREVAGDWICSRCDEENDAAFEFCWKCQKERGPNDTKQNPSAPEINPIAAPESNVAKSIKLTTAEKANPYQPVLLEPNAAPVDSGANSSSMIDDEKIDDTMRDLFRLACVSVLIIPIPLALYSVYRVMMLPDELQQHPRVQSRLRKYLFFYLLISTIVLAFWAAMLFS